MQYRCIPPILKYNITLIINDSSAINTVIDANGTLQYSLKDLFRDHPVVNTNYSGFIAVINSEGSSPATGKSNVLSHSLCFIENYCNSSVYPSCTA